VAELARRLPLDAGRGVALQQLGEPALAVDHHRAELEAAEDPAAAADARMGVEGATAIHADQGGQHQEDGQAEEEQRRRAGDVHGALGGRADQLGQPGAGRREAEAAIGDEHRVRHGGGVRLGLAEERPGGVHARHAVPRDAGGPAFGVQSGGLRGRSWAEAPAFPPAPPTRSSLRSHPSLGLK
jgi:hypothetical protein